jgi:catechol 2,3-dioxygenase-like lactoylglutathione lyase family enzyme
MITGIHNIIYTKNAEADRAFFRDVLGLDSVDAGHGWLIFALPPAELGIHPAEADQHEMFLMCDDIAATQRELEAKGVRFTTDLQQAGFGAVARFALPGGGELALYQPRHPTAIGQERR